MPDAIRFDKAETSQPAIGIILLFYCIEASYVRASAWPFGMITTLRAFHLFETFTVSLQYQKRNGKIFNQTSSAQGSDRANRP